MGWRKPHQTTALDRSAGTATSGHDDRTSRLVSNLDLRVIGLSAVVHQPWVMPFVGDWSLESCAYAATVGSNTTDNVEQVLIAAPAVSGEYTARVTFAGTLTDGSQPFIADPERGRARPARARAGVDRIVAILWRRRARPRLEW